MVLFYVDDVISISATPMVAIDGVLGMFQLKGNKAFIPEMYLGLRVTKVMTASGTEC